MDEENNGTGNENSEFDELLTKYAEGGGTEETGNKQSSDTGKREEGNDGNAEPLAEPIKRKRGRPKRETEEIRTPKETTLFNPLILDEYKEDEKPVRETLRSRKAKRTNALSNGLRILAEINKATKPEPLKPIWDIRDDELKAIADSISEILPDMPKKALDIFDKYSAYINVVAVTTSVIVGRVMAEKQILAELKAYYANVNNQNGTNPTPKQNRENPQSVDFGNGTNNETNQEPINFGFGNIFANANQF